MKNNDLDAYINGYTVKNDNEMSVSQAFSSNLDGLDHPNSILFLDEYNRQTRDQIRASVLTLINEHYVVGSGEDKRRYFPNFLFTIAVMNPHVQTDPGAAKLNDAEKSRFLYHLKHQDSDPVTTREYLEKYYGKKVRDELAKETPDYDKLETFLRTLDLGTFIVNDDAFEYDSEDDLYQLEAEDAKMLNQRSLTAGLELTKGDVNKFKDWLDFGANFLESDKDLLIAIVDTYQPKTRQQLFAALNLDAGNSEAASSNNSAEETEPTVSADTDLEDDADFFGQGVAAANVQSAAAVAKSLNDLLDSFDSI